MRFIQWSIALLALLSISTASLAEAQQAPFPDIADNPYEESITALQQRGVVKGHEDGNFHPWYSINRAELVTMLFTARGDKLSTESHCFPDVNEEWFATPICNAAERGYVKGYPDGEFRPGQYVNMVEALKIVLEGMDITVTSAAGDEHWYQPYVRFAHINNLFSQYAYIPNQEAKRAQIAFLIHQILRIKEGDRDLQTVRYQGSAGCGLTVPSNPPTRFTVHGVERQSITVIPKGYDPNTPISLVFAFHGRTNSNSMVQGYYGIERASNGQAIVVYPAGIKKGSSFTWSDGGDPPGELRDFALFDTILAEMQSKYCINQDQIYVIAHSLGAWFTNSLACARGDVIRAVGTLGGGRTNSYCTGPVAVMQWHNPKDRLVPYSQGLTARNQYIEQNRCSQSTIPIEPSSGNCVLYQGCSEEHPQVWCPHTQDYASYSGEYYPHNWPRGTGQHIWDFWQSLNTD